MPFVAVDQAHAAAPARRIPPAHAPPKRCNRFIGSCSAVAPVAEQAEIHPTELRPRRRTGRPPCPQGGRSVAATPKSSRRSQHRQLASIGGLHKRLKGQNPANARAERPAGWRGQHVTKGGRRRSQDMKQTRGVSAEAACRLDQKLRATNVAVRVLTSPYLLR